MDWETTIVEPAQAMGIQVMTFLPTLLLVIAVLFVGWIFSSLVQKAVTRFLKLARLDSISEKAGLANVLTKGDINYTLSEIVGVLVYWFVMLIVFLIAVNMFKLETTAGLLDKVISYIPSVIVSVLLLVLGIFFASIVANLVRTTAANSGVPQARSLGQFCQTIIIIFTIIESLKQLGINTQVVDIILYSIFGALTLGVGLAIGLGCKDMAHRYVSQLIDSFKPRK